jgi:hypothetical protein
MRLFNHIEIVGREICDAAKDETLDAVCSDEHMLAPRSARWTPDDGTGEAVA